APSEPPPPPPHEGRSWYVAPSGTSSGAGTVDAPWDLPTALAGARGAVQPGDTVWLRAGTYGPGSFHATSSGTAAAPIIVRQYPGERATIDGNLVVDGQYTWFWGFELTSSTTSNTNLEAITSHCPGCRFINLVIHDVSGSGLGLWSEGPDQEAYGNILYNVGYYAPGATQWAHGIYAQNQTGTKRLINNLLFDTFGYGLHVYGSDAAYLRNFTIDGNVVVNSGLGSGMDYQIGGTVPVENLTFTHNMSYLSPGRRSNTARIGYTWGPVNTDGTITDNYFVGQVMVSHWKRVTFERNTVIDPVGAVITLELADGQGMTTGLWSSNNYLKHTDGVQFAVVDPSGEKGYSLTGWQQATGLDHGSSLSSDTPVDAPQHIVVEPNQYEPGRANVIVYNWPRSASVSVDLSGVLDAGDRYEVRDAQNFFAPPVLSGTYSGDPIAIPMDARPAAPAIVPPPHPPPPTGPEFGVFVVLRVSTQ
ncbi:MAG: right-handed parallel beta-helix repeat-containing protein, partial [Gemmatimonadaceae bacterium]|nr:right-handed parallel beta-helix repeat-containing protein [Gemmatimonadaceae bacterium]